MSNLKVPKKLFSPTSCSYFILGLILLISSGTKVFQCPINRYLGIYCPGCGAIRALKAITRGSYIEAVHDNLLFLLMPIFAALGMLIKVKMKNSSYFVGYIFFLVALVLFFTFERNQSGSFLTPNAL
jgi:hypothetical protein